MTSTNKIIIIVKTMIIMIKLIQLKSVYTMLIIAQQIIQKTNKETQFSICKTAQFFQH